MAGSKRPYIYMESTASSASSTYAADGGGVREVQRELNLVTDDVIAKQQGVIAHQKETIVAQRVTIEAYRAILRLHGICDDLSDSDG